MAVDTIIANKALAHLGQSKAIADLATEKSALANVCRLFFEDARDEMLRDHVWGFATKYQVLSLIEQTPNTEYGYSYAYPSDCLYFQKMLSGIRNDTRGSVIHYIVSAGVSKTVMYTDLQNACGKYTSTLGRLTGRWSQDFSFALSYRLAAFIAPSIVGGDPFKLGDKAMANYKFAVLKAMAHDGNESQAEDIPDSELILARGGSIETRFTRGF